MRVSFRIAFTFSFTLFHKGLALQGNDLFKQGDYAGAIELYSEAIKIDPQNVMEQNHLYHANRSACYQNLKVRIFPIPTVRVSRGRFSLFKLGLLLHARMHAGGRAWLASDALCPVG